MTNKCFLVFGPESSGTRVLTKLLISCGCIGVDTHDQVWDSQLNWMMLPKMAKMPMVWRRSFPHARTWPDVVRMVQQVRSVGREEHIVIIVRSSTPTIASQRESGHADSNEAAQFNYVQGLAQIMSYVLMFRAKYTLITYEALQDKMARRALVKELGLNFVDISVVNKNKRRYAQILDQPLQKRKL
jgi:hypothetical protein